MTDANDNETDALLINVQITATTQRIKNKNTSYIIKINYDDLQFREE